MGPMLDIAFIRQNPDLVRAAIKNKRFDLDLDELLAADKARREITATIDVRRARKNEIGALIPKASKEERPALVEEHASTTVLMPGDTLTVDPFGNLVIAVGRGR